MASGPDRAGGFGFHPSIFVDNSRRIKSSLPVHSAVQRGEGSTMIQGLRTAIYPTPDLARGKDWYRQVLDHEPYFDEPFYVGFSVGGFELGLVPDGQPGLAS